MGFLKVRALFLKVSVPGSEANIIFMSGSNILKFLSETPEGMPEPVGPTITSMTQKFLRDIGNVIVGGPAYMAAAPFGALKGISAPIGRVSLLVASYPWYKINQVSGYIAQGIEKTRDKLVDLMSFSGSAAGGHSAPTPAMAH